MASCDVGRSTLVERRERSARTATFHTRTRAGADYAGEYQFLFAIRGDRIAEVWEQPDTLYQEQMGVFASYRGDVDPT